MPTAGSATTRRPDGSRRMTPTACPPTSSGPGSSWTAARAGTTDHIALRETTLDGRAVYELQWREKSGPPHWPTIARTLWVDRESYAPLRYQDHSFGKDAAGRPFDETFTETVTSFERLARHHGESRTAEDERASEVGERRRLKRPPTESILPLYRALMLPY
jgi:hypothetical protein